MEQAHLMTSLCTVSPIVMQLACSQGNPENLYKRAKKGTLEWEWELELELGLGVFAGIRTWNA